MELTSLHLYFIAILSLLTNLYPKLDIIFKDSLCATREHSYQLSYIMGDSMGGRHVCPAKKEHTHIVKVNLIIDKLYVKSYILN